MHVELGWPVFGGVGAERQDNIVARLSALAPSQRLIFTAHYDTKTDLFDHVVRTPIQLAGFPMAGLMFLAALLLLGQKKFRAGGKALERFAIAVASPAVLYGAAFSLAYAAGAVVPNRSPGAIDDGAACAVLLRAAAELKNGPPLAQTDIELIFFSGEELGAQGSRAYVASRFATRDPLSTFVLTLDPVGASDALAVTGTDTLLVRSYHPDAHIVSSLGSAVERVTGRPQLVTTRGDCLIRCPFIREGFRRRRLSVKSLPL